MSRTKLSFLFVMCYLLTPVLNIDEEVDNPYTIETKSYEFYKGRRSKEVKESCKAEEMWAYHLVADAQSIGEANEICPSVSQNCCGPTDHQRIKHFWWRDRKNQEVHHRTALLIMKWIVGYHGEFYKMAREFKDMFDVLSQQQEQSQNGGNQVKGKTLDGAETISYISPNLYCYEKAMFIIEKGYGTKERSWSLYDELTYRAQFMENSRRGFYCLMCSVEGQDALFTTWWIFKYLYNRRVYYHREFCHLIVNHTGALTYHLKEDYSEWLRSLLGMLTCFTVPEVEGSEANQKQNNNNNNQSGDINNSSPPQLSMHQQKLFDNPLGIEWTFWINTCNLFQGTTLQWIACEYFCQKWNIAKARDIYDFHLLNLKKLMDYLRKYRNIMKTPGKNHFRSDLVKMEDTIDLNFSKRNRAGIFYQSTSTKVDLAHYKSDFLNFGGVNPFELQENADLHFEYEAQYILSATAAILISILFYQLSQKGNLIYSNKFQLFKNFTFIKIMIFQRNYFIKYLQIFLYYFFFTLYQIF